MLLVAGDALIDFLPVAAGDGRPSYLPVAGGSCLNMAVTMARLGLPVGFMAGLSSDFFGDLLVDHLVAAGVDVSRVDRTARETTLAFVKLGDGEPQYVFYDEATAGRLWTRDAAADLGDDVILVHAGSVTLIEPPVADACLALFEAERGRRLLSVDPNCRPGLVRDGAAYRARLRRLFACADIVKLSAVDLAFAEPGCDPDAFAAARLAAGTALVVITRGEDGATGYVRAGTVPVPAEAVAVRDTVGAGDAFLGGLYAALADGGRLDRDALADLQPDDLAAALRYAARVAAITCTRTGADPPTRAEVAAWSGGS